MRQRSSRVRLAGAFVLLGTVLVAAPGEARQAGASAAQPGAGAPAVPVAAAQDARETRQQLEQLLRMLPPSVGAVLRVDPSLLRNEGYLATYPALAAFLQTHPDVINNADYYLQNVSTAALARVRPEPTTLDARTEAVRAWRGMVENLTVLLVVGVITGAAVWLLRSLIDLRRWSRTSRVQAEVHGKLLDRLTSNEDLLAYIQTPAGRRFLEAAPLATTPRAPSVSAPVSRMLWSVQAGVVLAAAAIGLLFISGRVIEELAQFIFAVGVLVLALGIGFVISAGASYLLSRRFGLLERPDMARSDASEA